MIDNKTYNMGFAIDGVPIPDPVGFGGSTSDLDTSAERDGTGLLHRQWVAQKVPTSMEYKNISWALCTELLKILNKPKFQFTFPDPNVGTTRTGTFYVGDRKWNCVWCPGTNGTMEWIAELSFSVIEY